MEFDERRYRPLSTVDLFDEAFDLYKRNFVLFLTIVAFVVIPSTVVTNIFAPKWMNALAAQLNVLTPDQFDFSVLLNYLNDWLKEFGIFLLVYIPVWTLGFAALTAAVTARYLDQPITVWASYLAGVRRYLSALIGTIIVLAIAFPGTLFVVWASVEPDLAPFLLVLGFLVGIITLIVVIARYPLYMSALVGERLGAIKALKRSSQLTKVDYGRIFLALFCTAFIALFISAAMEGILELLTGKLVDSAYLTVPAFADNQVVASQIAGGIANLLLTPFAVTVVTLLYFDQRIRKEGYDMEILADKLGYPSVSTNGTTVYAPALTSAPVKRGRK